MLLLSSVHLTIIVLYTEQKQVVQSDIGSSQKNMGRYFGVSLEDLLHRENCSIPSLVVSCITFICNQGIHHLLCLNG